MLKQQMDRIAAWATTTTGARGEQYFTFWIPKFVAWKVFVKGTDVHDICNNEPWWSADETRSDWSAVTWLSKHKLSCFLRLIEKESEVSDPFSPSVIQCYFLIYSEKGSPRKYRITSINETTSDPLIFNRFGMWRCFTFSPLWRCPKNNSTLLHETFLSHLTQCNVLSLRWNLYRPALSGIGETIDMQCGRGNDIVVDYLTWNH